MAHFTLRTIERTGFRYWTGTHWANSPGAAKRYATRTAYSKVAYKLSTEGQGIIHIYGHTPCAPEGTPDARYVNGDFELLSNVPGRGYVKQ